MPPHLTKHHKLGFEYRNVFTLMIFCEVFTRPQRNGSTPECLLPFRNEMRTNYLILSITGHKDYCFPIEMSKTPQNYNKHLALQILNCYPGDENVEIFKRAFFTHYEMLQTSLRLEPKNPTVLVEIGDMIEEGKITEDPKNGFAIKPSERGSLAALYFYEAIQLGLYNRANHLGFLMSPSGISNPSLLSEGKV